MTEVKAGRSRAWLAGLAGAAALAALAAPIAGANAQMQDDTIRFATQSISPGLGRPEFGTASPGVYTLWPIYESMTRVSPQGDVSGLLAVSWKNIDRDTWQFTLRGGVTFQNGKPFTAEAIVTQMNYLMSDDAAGTVGFATNKNQAKIASARAINDLTVEFKTFSPNPELPRMMAGFWIPEPGQWNDLPTEEYATNPIGTGPFQAVRFQGGVDGTVDYDAYAGAWRPAQVKHLQVISINGNAPRVAALVSDQVDIIQGVAMDSIDQIEAEGHRVDIAERPSAMGWRFMTVRKNSPFSDKRVRQAANMAIDRDSISKNLLRGISKPVGQCATTNTFGFNPDVKPYPFDPDKARALLAEAGYADGFDTEAMVLPGAFPADSEIYQIAAQQLTAIGIRVKLTNITFAQWLDNWYGRAAGPEDTMGMADIFQNSCHNFNAIPFDAYPNLSCRKDLPSHCDADEFALLERAEQEFDTEKRRQLIQQLMVLNHENAPNLFFVELVDLTGLNKRVNNFTNIIQRFSFDKITLSN